MSPAQDLYLNTVAAIGMGGAGDAYMRGLGTAKCDAKGVALLRAAVNEAKKHAHKVGLFPVREALKMLEDALALALVTIPPSAEVIDAEVRDIGRQYRDAQDGDGGLPSS